MDRRFGYFFFEAKYLIVTMCGAGLLEEARLGEVFRPGLRAMCLSDFAFTKAIGFFFRGQCLIRQQFEGLFDGLAIHCVCRRCLARYAKLDVKGVFATPLESFGVLPSLEKLLAEPSGFVQLVFLLSVDVVFENSEDLNFRQRWVSVVKIDETFRR